VNPRLFAVSGPVKDSSYPLPGGEVPLGRDLGNQISIGDPALSRRHCILISENGQYRIRDLQSRNGTFVNGVSVAESALSHGDQISVGDSVFVLLLEDVSEAMPGAVEFHDNEPTHTTSQILPQDVLYLQPDRLLGELPTTSRVARNLNSLLKISRAVHAIRDLDRLQEAILDHIFEIAPADRGAILLRGPGAEQIESVFARERGHGAHPTVRISRTIAQHVLKEGVALLGADVPGIGSLSGVESLVASQVHSLMCVPLSVFQKVIGCIYLDNSNPAARFHEDHLQLIAAIAAVCAMALENARHLQWLEQENIRLNTEINLEHNMVGESLRMKEVYQFLSRVAPIDATVLIQGESGTGKELVARALHRNSPRVDKPFIAINCAAIPEELLESELFGSERGAFTGAVTKKGRLEVANGGVVFLDEIGEMSPALQVKLLRVLQEREFERLGSNKAISVDIRLIAATNRDLAEAVKEKKFRQDLYFRLNVVALRVPPLRERREDIRILANYFVNKHGARCKVRPKVISAEAMACLEGYDWPGNVRELENAIERALVLGSSDMIRPEDLPETLLEKDPAPGLTPKYHVAVKEFKKQLIRSAIEEAKGAYADAARALGVHPNYLHRLIRNLDLKDSTRNQATIRPNHGKSLGNRL
jgi:transcriptional regulator with GAF, ATPase, and Fis domain